MEFTLEDFALDGKDLATREAKVSLGGSYISAGGDEFMFDGKAWVGLLTDDAPRETRAILLRCRRNRNAEAGAADPDSA